MAAARADFLVRPFFEDTVADATLPEKFVLHAHLFTKLLSDIIVEEDRFLLQTAVDLLDDPEGRRNVEEFAEQERRIRAIAVQAGPTLQRIETKYAYPQGM